MPEVQKVEQQPTEAVSAQTNELESLKRELQETKNRLDEKEKSWLSAQRTLTAKEQELKRRTDLEEHISAIEDRIELLATAIATGTQQEVEPVQDKNAVLQLLRKQREEAEARRKESVKKSADDEFAEKVHNAQQRVEALNLTPKDKRYHEIFGHVKLGLWELVDMEIGELEQAKTPKQLSPEEIDRMVEERSRQKLEEKGMLKTDTGGASAPKGQVWTWEQYKKMDLDEKRKNFGKNITAGFMKAVEEGKIKLP